MNLGGWLVTTVLELAVELCPALLWREGLEVVDIAKLASKLPPVPYTVAISYCVSSALGSPFLA